MGARQRPPRRIRTLRDHPEPRSSPSSIDQRPASTAYAPSCKNDPPSFGLAIPGRNVRLWLPGVRHRQANRMVLGMLRAALDLFCQMPVPSNVSRPSMSTRACPASQHRSPSVPSSAIPDPRNRMVAGAARSDGGCESRLPNRPSCDWLCGRDRAGRDLKRQPAVGLPRGDCRRGRRSVEEPAERAIGRTRRQRGGGVGRATSHGLLADPSCREREHAFDQRLDDIVFGLQIGEHAAGIER